MVAGEDETAHAGVAQQCPRRPQLLHNGVEDGGAELVFTRFVDLAAVDDDESGLGNRAFEPGGVAVDHVVQGEQRTGRAADTVVDGALARVGGVDAEFAAGKALYAAVQRGQHRRQATVDADRGQHVHADFGDGGQFGKAGVEVDAGGGALFELAVEFFGHFVAEGVYQEVGGGAAVLGERTHDVVEEGALLVGGRRQEAVATAEGVEVTRPGVGPTAPAAAALVETGAQPFKFGQLRVEARLTRLFQVTVRLIHRCAVFDVEIGGGFEADGCSQTVAGGFQGAVEADGGVDQLPGRFARRVVAQPEREGDGVAVEALVAPGGGGAPVAVVQGGQGGLEHLVFFKGEGVDLAQILGVGGFDFVGQQRFGGLGGAAVEGRMARAQVVGDVAAVVHHSTGQALRRGERRRHWRSFEVVDVFHTQRPTGGGEDDITGVPGLGIGQRRLSPRRAETDPGGQLFPERSDVGRPAVGWRSVARTGQGAGDLAVVEQVVEEGDGRQAAQVGGKTVVVRGPTATVGEQGV